MSRILRILTLAFLSLAPVSAADASSDLPVIPLWPNGAPGFENRRDEPEEAASWWVKNIHNPSLTVLLPPKEKATGAAIVVCAGGGFRELGFNGEGIAPSRFLTNHGVAAFALKYRLPRMTNSPYKLPDHPTQDIQRALRLIRSRAAEWNIDTNRLGVIGFSAGGEVASYAAYTPGHGDPAAPDPIDRLPANVNFQIMIYPGPLGLPEVVPTNAPPALFIAANDDRQPARSIAAMLPRYQEAKVPIEVHLYSKGGHAFNMGTRTTLSTIKGWPDRLADWLHDTGITHPDRAQIRK